VIWALLAAALSGLWLARGALVRRLVRWRLGPFRVVVSRVDERAPVRLTGERRVAVIGGGVAGISAASALGGRGYRVTLFEANAYLGGKLGSWPVQPAPDRTEWVSHGYHAFFRHYYNLNRFLDALGLRHGFRAISDYRILLAGGGEISFGNLERTPGLNLLSMVTRGLVGLRYLMSAPARDLMGVFLEYQAGHVEPWLDRMSFAEFDRLVKLPPRLKVAFSTFARAFFADESRMSMAELVKAFHFYFLGHDGGLIYDYPVHDYEVSLLKPIRGHLASLGVATRLSSPVSTLAWRDGLFRVNGEWFDRVVLAADVAGARRVLSTASGLEGLDRRLSSLEPGQRYAVLRLWLDRAPRGGLPVFVVTERHRVLDAITFLDRAEAESEDWVREHGGSVMELHSYAVPDDVPDQAVRDELLDELTHFLPELRVATVRHEHLQLRRDFTAFHVGMSVERPETESGVPGLYCAGDWVRLPFPAMHLEAAFSSGLWAANRILEADGLREELVESVPLRGLMAGVRAPRARQALLPREA